MNNLVFSIVVYSFVSLSVLTTLFFLGMMIADDIHNPNKGDRK